MPFLLLSPGFSPGAAIPGAFTCDGGDFSPPLEWSGAPPNTASFVVGVIRAFGSVAMTNKAAFAAAIVRAIDSRMTTFGTFRTSCDVRLRSTMYTKADVGRPL